MSDSSPTLRPYVPIDNDGRLIIDLPCFDCQYNLRTQHIDGNCPECGLSVEQSLTGDNALLMPAFWLGQVVRGAVCIAISFPLVLACGIGIVLWLIGVLTITLDPPLRQFRIRNLQRWVLIPLLFAGLAPIAIGLSLNVPALAALLTVVMLGALSISNIMLHLFARKTARAAQLNRHAAGATVMAGLTAAMPVTWLMLIGLLILVEHGVLPYEAAEFVPPLALLLLVGYGLVEIVFWSMFAWSINRVRIEALGLADQRRLQR